MSPLVFIGYPKTGSQWLLRSLFSNPSCGYLLLNDGEAIADQFIRSEPEVFDPHAIRRDYEVSLRDAADRGLVAVLHHEGLAASLFEPGPPNVEVLDRVAEVFPRARILLNVREQRSAVLSWYRHNVRLGLAAALSEFLPLRGCDSGGYFDCRVLEYSVLVEHLLRRFGESRVCVQPYELLCADSAKYLAQITEFAGAPSPPPTVSRGRVNSGFGPSLTLAECITNRILRTRYPRVRPDSWLVRQVRRMPRGLARVQPRWVEDVLLKSMKSRIAVAVEGRYNSSNRELSRLLGVDLSVYGYAV